MIQGAGDADALPLTSRQADTALPHMSRVALRQLGHHEIVQIRDARRALNSRLIDEM